MMEVPLCHSRNLRFDSVDGEVSLKNLNKGRPENKVCFRQNILAALVIRIWSGISLVAGRPLYLSRLQMPTGCQCLFIPVLGSTAPRRGPDFTCQSEQAAIILKRSAPLMSGAWNCLAAKSLASGVCEVSPEAQGFPWPVCFGLVSMMAHTLSLFPDKCSRGPRGELS